MERQAQKLLSEVIQLLKDINPRQTGMFNKARLKELIQEIEIHLDDSVCKHLNTVGYNQGLLRCKDCEALIPWQ